MSLTFPRMAEEGVPGGTWLGECRPAGDVAAPGGKFGATTESFGAYRQVTRVFPGKSLSVNAPEPLGLCTVCRPSKMD